MKKGKEILSDEAVRKIVMARLSVLSPDTVISLGADGSFSRDELVDNVMRSSRVGEKIAEIQMEWLRSFKEQVLT